MQIYFRGRLLSENSSFPAGLALPSINNWLMNLDSPSEDELSSSVPHSLFNEHYEQDIQELFAKFQILETSIKHYQSVPLSRKQERLKQSFTLFRAYWQNALKMLLPYVDEKSLTSQRLFMRYGLVHLSDISEQDLQTLELTTVQTKSSSLLLYMDEWFHNVMEGKIEPLQQDAATPINSASNNNKEAFHLQAIRDSTALETLTEKLCVESKSVATPFLHKNDLNQPLALQIASREIVEKMLHLIKDLDPQIFTRKLLKETVDLEPYIILIPSYSKWGTCWEAFDRFKAHYQPGAHYGSAIRNRYQTRGISSFGKLSLGNCQAGSRRILAGKRPYRWFL